MFADLAVLDSDYFTVAEEQIKNIESVLTIVDGRIVYAKGDFSAHAPDEIPVLPDWSPTKNYNGYYAAGKTGIKATGEQIKSGAGASLITAQIHNCLGSCNVHGHEHQQARLSNVPVNNYTAFWGVLGCSCFAF